MMTMPLQENLARGNVVRGSGPENQKFHAAKQLKETSCHKTPQARLCENVRTCLKESAGTETEPQWSRIP